MDDEQPQGFEIWFGKPLALLIFFIGLPWALLTLNDQGVLVGSEKYLNSYGDQALRCTYFIGVHTSQKVHLTIYKQECPLFETLPN